MRLKQKVTKLEALLARSCERLRSTNVLKHGLEYQMTGKVSWINLVPPIQQRFFSLQKQRAFYLVLVPIWEHLHLPRALERHHWMVTWNHANLIVHSRSSHRALSVFCSNCALSWSKHCAYLNAMQNLYQTSFRLGSIRNWFQTGSSQFELVRTEVILFSLQELNRNPSFLFLFRYHLYL